MNEKSKLINLELHPKEYQLIQFFRKQFRNGAIEIKIHGGLPDSYIIKTIEGRFDGNLQKTVDNRL